MGGAVFGTVIRTGVVLVMAWVMVAAPGSFMRSVLFRVGSSASPSPLGLRYMLHGSTAKMSEHLASDLTAVFVPAMQGAVCR